MQSQIFRIVFQDSSLLVIEKLRPFLAQRGDLGRHEGLDEFLARHLDLKIFPVHRLDREVLGLMIYGLTKSAATHLTEQFRNRSIAKGYECSVHGRVFDDEKTLVHFLKKNARTNHVTVYGRASPGAKRAELTYRVLERSQSHTRVWVRLKTGRTHQIRVQMAKMGHPLLGDHRYGRRNDGLDDSIHLRSVFLSCLHPQTEQRMTWTLIEKNLQKEAEAFLLPSEE